MRSIYEQAFGDKFKLLHPRIQERFGFSSKDRCASIGRGIMHRLWRGRFIIDYLGTHQHLAVDIDLNVDERGGLRLRSGKQRFYEGLIGFSFPMMFSGVADVCEWFDDGDGKYHIEVNVHNDYWGPLFGYSGSFNVEWVKIDGQIPQELVPVRYERRD